MTRRRPTGGGSPRPRQLRFAFAWAPFPFHEKAIQVKADVAAFLKIIASVWLHDSTPTHGRRQPAAAPTQVCVCMGPLSLISGRGSERPGDVKSARSGRGAANP